MTTDNKLDLSALRRHLVAGSRVWATHTYSMDGDCCLALSGASSLNANVAYCFGGDLPADLIRCMDEVTASRFPTALLLAGAPLEHLGTLTERNWVQVNELPFMRRPASAVASVADSGVRRLGPEDLAPARVVYAESYRVAPPIAAAMLPEALCRSASDALFGLEVDGELVSIVVTTVEARATGIWCMATPVRFQRRGYGQRLLGTVMSSLAADCDHFLLYASEAGLRLYQSLGFEFLEAWPVWTRRRFAII